MDHTTSSDQPETELSASQQPDSLPSTASSPDQQSGSSVAPTKRFRLSKHVVLVICAGIVAMGISGGLVYAQLGILARQSKTAPVALESAGQSTKSNTESKSPDDSFVETAPPSEAPPTSAPAPTPAPAPAPTRAPAPKPKQTPAPSATPAPIQTPAPTPPLTPTPVTHTMNYTDSCYSPVNLTIKKGDTVKFVNTASSRSMWPASNNHPSHTLYSEFDASGSIAPGGTYSFTFNKTGAWGYHDHLRSSCTGVITVQ